MARNTDNVPKPLKGIRNQDLYGQKQWLTDAETANQIASDYNRAKYLNYKASQGSSGWNVDIHGSRLAPQDVRNYGQSQYDIQPLFQATSEDIQNERAAQQPWYDRIANGITKGTVLAGTTFINGTAGLLYGVASAIANQRFSDLWNNDITRGMNAVNNAMENSFTNYASVRQQEAPWYSPDYWASSQFLGEDLIKNIGFTVGAIYSGSAWNKALSVIGKLALQGTKALPAINNAIKAVTGGAAKRADLVGSTIAAIGEGSAEAIQNSNDWAGLQYQKLEDNHKQILQSIKQNYGNTEMAATLLRAENQRYDKARQEIDLRKRQMGNLDLIMNLPILTLSNWVQFGKMYSRGFDTARRVGVTKNAEGYISKLTPTGKVLRTVGNIVKAPLSEGMEEVNQQAASNISGKYYENVLDNFYKMQNDPQGRRETASFLKAAWSGLSETLTDNDTWKQFLVGSITGAMGLPGVKKNEAGKWRLTWNGGIKDAISEGSYEDARTQEIVDYLNERGSSKTAQSGIKATVRHKILDTIKNEAAGNNDKQTFITADDLQTINDVLNFDDAGKIDDYVTQVNASWDGSDQQLQEIKDNSKESGIFDGLTDDEIRQKLDQKKQDQLHFVDQIKKAKSEILSRTAGTINDAPLKMAITYQVMSQRFEDRKKSLNSAVSELLNNLKGSIDSTIAKIPEGTAKQKLLADKAAIEYIASSDTPVELLQNKDYKNLIQNYFDDKESKEAINTLIENYNQLDKAKKDAIDKYNKIVENPVSYQKELAKQDEEQGKKEQEEEESNFTFSDGSHVNPKKYLGESSNIHEFRERYHKLSGEGYSKVDDVVQSLQKEGNQVALDYQDSTNYANDLYDAVNSLHQAGNIDDSQEVSLNNEISNREQLAENVESFQSETPIQDLYQRYIDQGYDEKTAATKAQNTAYLYNVARFIVNSKKQWKDRMSKYYEPVTGYTLSIEDKGNFISYKATSRKGAKKVNDFVTFNAADLVDNPKTNRIGINEVRVDKNGRIFANVSWIDDKGGAKLQEGVRLKVNPFDIGVNITQTNAEDTNSTGADAVTRVPEGGSTVTKTPQPPSSTVSDGELNDANSNVNNPNTLNKNSSGQYEFYMPAISEYDLTQRDEKGRIKPVPLEESRAQYKDIIDLLKALGAFDNVNKGLISIGDKVEFVIDHNLTGNFEESHRQYYPEDKPMILMVVNKDGKQLVIGSLNRSNSKDYAGLDALIDNIYKEYKDADKSKPFSSSITSSVMQVIDGQFKFGDYQVDSSKINNLSHYSLAVVDANGNLVGKGTDKVRNFHPSSDRAGRIYLLIKGSSGNYIPVMMSAHHFNVQEWTLENKSKTPVGQKIIGILNNIVKAAFSGNTSNTEGGLAYLRQQLGSYIYTEPLSFNISEDQLVIAGTIFNQNGQQDNIVYRIPLYTNENITIGVLGAKGFEPNGNQNQGPVERPAEDVLNDIVSTLQKFNLPMQVDKQLITNRYYVNELISSDVIYSNLIDASIHNSSVLINPISGKQESKGIPAKVPQKELPAPGSAVESHSITVGNQEYIVEVYGGIPTLHIVKNGQKSLLPVDKQSPARRIIVEMALLDEDSRNKNTASNGVYYSHRVKNYLDTTTGKIASKEKADKAHDELFGSKELVDTGLTLPGSGKPNSANNTTNNSTNNTTNNGLVDTGLTLGGNKPITKTPASKEVKFNPISQFGNEKPKDDNGQFLQEIDLKYYNKGVNRVLVVYNSDGSLDYLIVDTDKGASIDVGPNSLNVKKADGSVELTIAQQADLIKKLFKPEVIKTLIESGYFSKQIQDLLLQKDVSMEAPKGVVFNQPPEGSYKQDNNIRYADSDEQYNNAQNSSQKLVAAPFNTFDGSPKSLLHGKRGYFYRGKDPQTGQINSVETFLYDIGFKDQLGGRSVYITRVINKPLSNNVPRKLRYYLVLDTGYAIPLNKEEIEVNDNIDLNSLDRQYYQFVAEGIVNQNNEHEDRHNFILNAFNKETPVYNKKQVNAANKQNKETKDTQTESKGKVVSGSSNTVNNNNTDMNTGKTKRKKPKIVKIAGKSTSEKTDSKINEVKQVSKPYIPNDPRATFNWDSLNPDDRSAIGAISDMEKEKWDSMTLQERDSILKCFFYRD